jgi:ABC-type polysaccharide/polyol phosphate export permease
MAVTNAAVVSIVSSAGFLKTMKVPKEPFVIAGLLQFLFSHLFEMILLVALALYLKLSLVGFLAYPVIFGFFSLFILGCSFVLATIGVAISDLSNIWVILGRLLWFATPVFYSVNKAHSLHTFNLFNPLYHFISAARDVILYQQWPPPETVISIVFSAVISFSLGIFIFSKYKKNFAQRL